MLQEEGGDGRMEGRVVVREGFRGGGGGDDAGLGGYVGLQGDESALQWLV